MKATYIRLPDYSHLMGSVSGKDLEAESVMESGRILPATLDLIKKAWRLGIVQVAPLAQHLKGDTFAESCYNIYDWVISNIPYSKDAPGQEEVRLPARTYKDRTGDCEDYAILIGGLLHNMGYEPRFEVVGFVPGRQVFSHIFCVAYYNGQSIPIDTTPYQDGLGPVVPFGTRPAGIQSTMELRLLGNVSANNFSSTKMISGLSGLGTVTELTQRALDEQTEMVARYQNNYTNPDLPKSFRKARMVAMLNGLPEAPVFHGVRDLIDDIDSVGNLMLKAGVEPEEFGELVGVLDAWSYHKFSENTLMGDIEGLGGLTFDSSDSRYENYRLEGVGSWFSRTLKKVKSKVSQAAKATGTAIKKAATATGKAVTTAAKATGKAVTTAAKATGGAVKTFVKNPLYYINKVNPATIILRNGLLLALKLNSFKVSSRMKYGYLSDEQVRAKGYNPAEHAKMKKAVSNMESIFDKLGGEKTNLKAAIIKGGGGLGSLGEAAAPGAGAEGAGGAASVALPILKKILEFLKGIDFMSFFGGKRSKDQEAETELSVDEANRNEAELNASKVTNQEEFPTGVNPNTFNNPAEMEAAARLARENFSTSSGSNPGQLPDWVVPVGIAAALGLVIIATR
jgi:hypothetical protein